MSVRKSAVQLVKNTALATQTVVRHVMDDPILLALQVSRRLPHRLQITVGELIAHVPGAGFSALGASMQGLDFPDDARALLGMDPAAPGRFQSSSLPASHMIGTGATFTGTEPQKTQKKPKSPLQKRLCAEVAIGYGLVDWRDENLPAITRARAAWDMGAVSQAIELADVAGARSYAARLRGEQELLTSQFLSQPARSTAKESSGAITAVHMLTNSLPATQSGYTLRSQRLLNALAHGAAGVKVAAFTRIGYPVMVGGLAAQATAQVEKINYRRVLPWRLGFTHADRSRQWADHVLSAVRQLQKAGEVDRAVVHTTTNYPNAVAARMVAEGLGAPWVYEVRGVMEETWVSNKKTAPAREEAAASERFALIRTRETEMMNQAHHVLTLSGVMKHLLVERGIPAEKISVVPNAVSDSLFSLNLSPAQARAELDLPQEGFWVGSVSSLVDYEGFDTLLSAVALLRRQGADVRALIAGDGVARGSLERLAADLGLVAGESVFFLGKVAPDLAFTAHQALNVFVVPRRNVAVARSVTPLKPIEAMALGRAVVASDIPPLAELVDNGVTPAAGLLAEPDSAESFAQSIERLMNDSALYEQVVDAGRAFAATRTWAQNARIIERVYEDLWKGASG